MQGQALKLFGPISMKTQPHIALAACGPQNLGLEVLKIPR